MSVLIPFAGVVVRMMGQSACGWRSSRIIFTFVFCLYDLDIMESRDSCLVLYYVGCGTVSSAHCIVLTVPTRVCRRFCEVFTCSTFGYSISYEVLSCWAALKHCISPHQRPHVSQSSLCWVMLLVLMHPYPFPRLLYPFEFQVAVRRVQVSCPTQLLITMQMQYCPVCLIGVCQQELCNLLRFLQSSSEGVLGRSIFTHKPYSMMFRGQV